MFLWVNNNVLLFLYVQQLAQLPDGVVYFLETVHDIDIEHMFSLAVEYFALPELSTDEYFHFLRCLAQQKWANTFPHLQMGVEYLREAFR